MVIHFRICKVWQYIIDQLKVKPYEDSLQFKQSSLNRVKVILYLVGMTDLAMNIPSIVFLLIDLGMVMPTNTIILYYINTNNSILI